MLRTHQRLLSKLLLALWLAGSSVGVLHAVEHALEGDTHVCTACVHAQHDGATPQATTLQLPNAAAPATAVASERAAHCRNNLAHAPRGPPAQF